MQTIAQAFDTYLSRLELTEAERSNASGQHSYLREQLQQRMDVQDNFLTGSYARKTAIRPLNDIDVFLVLEPTSTLHAGSSPDAVLNEVKQTLETIYDGKVARKQSRSVNIEFTGTGIAYDVVPAFSGDDAIYTIPDVNAAAWIYTNPRIHIEQATAANERAGKKLKPLLKAVKHANYRLDSPARSFHLEVLSWKLLDRDPGAYINGLVTLLDGVAANLCEPCEDPAGLGADIRPAMDRCRDAQRRFSELAALGREAQQLAYDGRTGEAHARLRELFGDQWPERGTSAARSASVVVTTSAVDHPHKRFG